MDSLSMLYAATTATIELKYNHSLNMDSTMDMTASCSLFTFTIYAVLFGVMCVFGLIGNTVSFVVLNWERHSYVATFLLRVSVWKQRL